MSVTSNFPSEPIGTVCSTAPAGASVGAAAPAGTAAPVTASCGRNSTGTCTVSTAPATSVPTTSPETDAGSPPSATCRSVICCPTCTVTAVASDADAAAGYQISAKPAPVTRNRYEPLGSWSIFHVPSAPVAVCFTGTVVADAAYSSTVTPATGAPLVSNTTVPPRVEEPAIATEFRAAAI